MSRISDSGVAASPSVESVGVPTNCGRARSNTQNFSTAFLLVLLLNNESRIVSLNACYRGMLGGEERGRKTARTGGGEESSMGSVGVRTHTTKRNTRDWPLVP